MHFLHVCPACFVLKILEFVSAVTRLLAAVYAGLPRLGHAVESRSEFLHLPEHQSVNAVFVGFSPGYAGNAVALVADAVLSSALLSSTTKIVDMMSSMFAIVNLLC